MIYLVYGVIKMKNKLIEVVFLTILGLGIISIHYPIYIQAGGTEQFSTDEFPYRELFVHVMPEFAIPSDTTVDSPFVLIGYHGTLVNKSGEQYSGEIEIPVPVNFSNFKLGFFAEYTDQEEEKIELDYEIDKEKGIVTWQPSKPIEKDGSYQFVIEFYYTPIEVGENKTFSYSFEPYTDTDKANIVIYKPFGAENFLIVPATEHATTNAFGVEMFGYQYNSLKKGDKKDFQVTYLKEDNETTMDKINNMQAPNDEIHSGFQNDGNVQERVAQPLISNNGAIIIGISIVVAGILLMLGLRFFQNDSDNNEIQIKKENDRITPEIDEEKKKLRKIYADGAIDKKEYMEKLNRLNEGIT